MPDTSNTSANAPTADEFDVVVIGGGPAGENAADFAIRGSDRTAAIVETELIGGECSYYACMPSKALLRPVDVVHTAEHLGGVTGARLDRAALLARRDDWVSHYDDSGQADWAEQAGITVLRGRGRITGDRTVSVDPADSGAGDPHDGESGDSGAEGDSAARGDRRAARTVRARQAVVIATGSTAVIPDPFTDLNPWTSRDATGIVEVPDRIAVIGGGVVACEAATWLAALGATVILLVRGNRLLAAAEPFAGDAVADGLRAAGVDVRLDTAVRAAAREQVADTGLGKVHGGPVALTLDPGGSLTVDEVLVATGRRPATAGIGLETIGVDENALHGRTNGGELPGWLYTVGDVNGVAPLTHWGKYQGRQVGRLIAARADGGPEPGEPQHVPVPQVVFTDPQVAWVGQTEQQANDAGASVRILRAAYTSAAGAGLLRDDAAGTAQLVVDNDSGVLLGATFVGPDVAELLHAATIAIVGKVPVEALRDAVPSYPTASEVWLRLIDP